MSWLFLLLLQIYLLGAQSIEKIKDNPECSDSPTDLGVLSGLLALMVLKETQYLAVSVS